MSNKKFLGILGVKVMNFLSFLTSIAMVVGGSYLSIAAIFSSHAFTGVILFILSLVVGIGYFRMWNGYLKPLLYEGVFEHINPAILKKAS
ncbi:hypothetical protein [Neobacillus terrae]|uniref:hypothetical protein n=1 Tax=Neobacillus terrae TaxID=3034837 RepID=UPI00140CB9C8|nr:hypothetical protein [Neobacillus terrae]NHM33890.1 hypothetical protein [Neobacillus terrae]